MTSTSKPNRDSVKAKRDARETARTQSEKNLANWSDLTVVAGGDVDEYFTPSRSEETGTRESLITKAKNFISKFVAPFSDFNTKTAVPEAADSSLIRAYSMVEAFLGISEWKAGSPPIFHPGKRSLLINVSTLEQALAITKAYSSDIYWRTIGLPRETKEQMIDNGSWHEGRYPESDISSLVLPFWNGVEAWMGEDGGLPVAPYERSTMVHGWRFYTTATEVSDSEVWLTSYLFGPGAKPRQSLTAVPREPSWRPTLMAVRHQNVELATFNSYYVEGLSALAALAKLEDRNVSGVSFEADADDRRKRGAEIAHLAATGDLGELDK